MSDLKAQIASQLVGVTTGDVDLSFSIEGRTIHARLLFGPAGASSLVTLFHGAVDLKSRQLPFFDDGLWKVREVGHRLAFADPSVNADTRANICWFAGEHDFDTPAHISALVMAISEHLGVSRRLYYGSSGGGFAALALSHRDPGSYAVACNPQTNISRYGLGSAIQRYRETAWPQMADNDGFQGTTFGDMTQLYRNGFDNTVVYVQNISDRAQFERQMMPFIAAIKDRKNRDRLILSSEFHGKFGHVSSPHEYMTWVIAICTAPSDGIDDILMTRHEQIKSSRSSPKLEVKPPEADPPILVLWLRRLKRYLRSIRP